MWTPAERLILSAAGWAIGTEPFLEATLWPFFQKHGATMDEFALTVLAAVALKTARLWVRGVRP